MSKTIFITDAMSTVGLAFCRRFLMEGHRVIAAGLQTEKAEELTDEFGVAILAFNLDISNHTAVSSVYNTLPKNWEQIDVLINNAEVTLGDDVPWDVNLSDLDRIVATNVSSLIHVTRAILPKMVERNYGTIINLGSTLGTYPAAGNNIYGASKAFVKHFSLSLRTELVGTNIHVTDLEPGPSNTDENKLLSPDKRKHRDASNLGKSALSADDIAQTATWIVSLPEHVNINLIEITPTQ